MMRLSLFNSCLIACAQQSAAIDLNETSDGASSWPTFEDKNALEGNKWGAYYKAVYGEVPSTGYPIKTEDLMMLYDDVLEKHGVTELPKVVGKCPGGQAAKKGVHYSGLLEAKLTPPGISWIWHPPPFHGKPNDTWVEVLQSKDSFDRKGAWMFITPGSGIWFNLGKTQVFKEHQDAYDYYKVDLKKAGQDGNIWLAERAAKAGWDTLQFTAHADPKQYPCTTEYAMAHEIMAPRLQGMYTCMSRESDADWLKSGWNHKDPCHCDSKLPYLNCLGKAEAADSGDDDHKDVSSAVDCHPPPPPPPPQPVPVPYPYPYPPPQPHNHHQHHSHHNDNEGRRRSGFLSNQNSNNDTRSIVV